MSWYETVFTAWAGLDDMPYVTDYAGHEPIHRETTGSATGPTRGNVPHDRTNLSGKLDLIAMRYSRCHPQLRRGKVTPRATLHSVEPAYNQER
jgi:hypothetical protein